MENYIFQELSFFEILGGQSFSGGLYLLGGPGTFWNISCNIYHTFYFLVFIFHEDVKILYLPQKFLYFFCGPCLYAIVQKFRLLDNVILIHAKNLGMTLKDLVSVSSAKFFSVW